MTYNFLIKNDLEKLPHNLYWQIPRDGAQFLQTAVQRIKPRAILEVGTSSGYSTIWLAEGLYNSGIIDSSKIYTIESNQNRYEFSQQNFLLAGLQNIIVGIKGHAPQAIPSNITYDLVFFDGTKSQTIDFFNAVWDNLSLQGEVLVDNVISHKEKMQPFFNFLETKGLHYKVLEIGAGICQIAKNQN